MILGYQQVKPCPCNDPDCKKWVVYPLFAVPEASLSKEEAEEVVKRLNGHE